MTDDLKAIEQQLQYALDEVHKRRSDKQLLHDWIFDSLTRVKNLNLHSVVLQSEQLPCNHEYGIKDNGDFSCFCGKCGKLL